MSVGGARAGSRRPSVGDRPPLAGGVARAGDRLRGQHTFQSLDACAGHVVAAVRCQEEPEQRGFGIGSGDPATLLEHEAHSRLRGAQAPFGGRQEGARRARLVRCHALPAKGHERESHVSPRRSLVGGPRDPGQPGRWVALREFDPQLRHRLRRASSGGACQPLGGGRLVRRAAHARSKGAGQPQLALGMADACCFLEPLDRGRRVALDAMPFEEQHAERHLTRSVAADGRGLQVARRRLRVDGDAATLREHQA